MADSRNFFLDVLGIWVDSQKGYLRGEFRAYIYPSAFLHVRVQRGDIRCALPALATRLSYSAVVFSKTLNTSGRVPVGA